ncbi:beta strand repeat-containing protein [Colwellia echini]|uniref:Big-1 domain-containing protein n=1 Tax=Colwellia echini TaxID=1982103 RepID=A0ABY3MVG1_9GAMM|nr:hypothetical protein [Colwellia echini]TYK65206.1 hypothetical protein CWS31_012110 [Colwellia echini]
MQLLRRLSFTMLLMSMMTLVACGGGDISGGDDGGDGGTSGGVALTLTKSDGELSAANAITVTATVLDSDTPVVNKTVTFSLAVETMGVLDPVSATATTDANGVASIVVKVTNTPGSVNVIASYEGVTEDISFQSLGDGAQVIVGEPEAASIRLFASSQQLASSGAQSIVLSAIAKDINNNLLEGVTINFSTDSGALANVINGSNTTPNVTGADGKVSKLLSTLDEPTNRIINVTVVSGDISDSLEIEVVGTTLTLTGSASLALNDEATYIVKVVDSDGNGVAKTAVAVALTDTDAEVTIPTTVTTNSEGQATIKATGTSGGTNTITVSALGATASQKVSVQADSFQFTSFSNGVDTINPSTTPNTPDVSLIQTASVTLTWTREGATVPDGTSVSFTTTRGSIKDSGGIIINEATTVDGKVSIQLTSTDAGKALVTFVGTDTVGSEKIELTNQIEFEFYASSAATIKAQASPNSIGPNAQTSSISVVVNDANGNLVKNKKIKFVLEDVSGGSIFPATAVTDSNGSASTIYTSNSTSAKNAVSITAVVVDSPAITDTVNLTVSDRELFISLGTGNALEELGSTDYVKEYSVFVTDVDSNAVESVALTVSAIPENYYKGKWVKGYDLLGDFVSWVTEGQVLNESKTKCSNEDINFNGILDVDSNGFTEDFNGDNELTPGNIVSIAGTLTTDTDGRAVIRISYPQSYGSWLDVKLVVSGKVTGSESSTQAIFTLPTLASDVTNEDVTPPTQGINLRGPFGLSNDCELNISQDPSSD